MNLATQISRAPSLETTGMTKIFGPLVARAKTAQGSRRL